MIEQLVSSMLAPLIDRISEIESELESGARRGRNAIQMGTVVEVVDQRVVIAIGKARTPPIKWFACAAGDVIECRYPSQGELALVLNYGSGDRNTSSIALVGIPSDQFPLLSSDPNKVARKIGALGMEEWDKETGKLTVTAPGGVEFVTSEVHSTGEMSDATRSMSADRKIYNDHDHPHGDPLVGKVNQKQ
jgi:phage baseplate assembly protein gpV